MEEYLQQPGGEQPDFEVMGDYAVTHVRVCCDDSSQDWWHSTQVFTTALLLLKAKCPFLKQGSLYSDGAGNFKGLAFTAMLPQISARTGIRIKHHVLPEAGDGKDDCDRDFNGCNILFASYVKVDGRSMTNANEICEALERGKGRGVINCALAVSKAAVAAPEFKPDTSKFTKLVGKSKTNLFHTKFEYKEDGSFSGFRFWVAFGFGEGKFVTAAQLGTCLAGTRPDLSTFKPIITYGTTLDECTPVLVDELKYRDSKKTKRAKVEDSNAHKKAKREASVLQAHMRREKAQAHTKQNSRAQAKKLSEIANRAAAIDARKAHAAAVVSAMPQRRRAFRCPTCDYVSHFASSRDLHAAVCFGFPSEEAQIMAKVSTFNFGAEFSHARLDAAGNDDMQMQLAEACPAGHWYGHPLTAAQKAEQVNQSVVFCVHDMVDKVVHQGGTSSRPEMPSGWATREQCVRDSTRFPQDVVALLEKLFNSEVQLSNDQIADKLRDEFKWGRKCLRVQQVSGWVSSRVKKQQQLQKHGVIVEAAQLAIAEKTADMAAEDEASEQQLDAEEEAEDEDEDEDNEENEETDADTSQAERDEQSEAEDSEAEDSEAEEAGGDDNEWDMSVDVGVDMGDGMCTVALDDLPDADITAALFNLEEKKKEWRLKGRALCTKQVCVDSEGVVNWLSNVQASAKFMHRQVLGPETTEDDEGGLVEVEGMVKQVVFGHRSADVAVCYVEFEAIGTHKLLTVEDVVQGNLSLH